jgi:hypothetical protein
MSDVGNGMVAITPNTVVPHHRAVEWFTGTRPLDGMDANFYFKASVDCGVLTAERALELHQRHLRLTRQEEAVARGEFLCKTCRGEPPTGFVCRACGTEGD